MLGDNGQNLLPVTYFYNTRVYPLLLCNSVSNWYLIGCKIRLLTSWKVLDTCAGQSSLFSHIVSWFWVDFSSSCFYFFLQVRVVKPQPGLYYLNSQKLGCLKAASHFPQLELNVLTVKWRAPDPGSYAGLRVPKLEEFLHLADNFTKRTHGHISCWMWWPPKSCLARASDHARPCGWSQ